MFNGHGDIGNGGAANRYDRTSFFSRQGTSLSSQYQRSYLLCSAKYFSSILRCCNPNLHCLCRESILADVILLQLSAQSFIPLCIDWPSYCTVNSLLIALRMLGPKLQSTFSFHCTVQCTIIICTGLPNTAQL